MKFSKKVVPLEHEILKNFVMKKTVLILLYASCCLTFNYNNYIYALDEEDKRKVLNFITHINSINLKEGLGASVSYAVDENIRAYARSSGLNEKYWALRAIDKKFVESGDVIAKKFASSIELLKKIIAGCFYKSNATEFAEQYTEYTISSVAEIINKCIRNGVNLGEENETKNLIFSLINGMNALNAVSWNILASQKRRKNF